MYECVVVFVVESNSVETYSQLKFESVFSKNEYIFIFITKVQDFRIAITAIMCRFDNNNHGNCDDGTLSSGVHPLPTHAPLDQ